MDRLIPFTPDVYVGMIARYNLEIWPGHLIALAFIWTMIVCARRGGQANGRVMLTLIAGFWIWVGYGFHMERYAQLNWAALAFGWIFILQGALILLWGATAKTIDARLRADKFGAFGLLLIAASIALHPGLVLMAGSAVSAGQIAGTAPLSLMLLSFGGTAFLTKRPPAWLIALPLLWCLWEFAWSWTLGLWPDYTLALIGFFIGILQSRPRHGQISKHDR